MIYENPFSSELKLDILLEKSTIISVYNGSRFMYSGLISEVLNKLKKDIEEVNRLEYTPIRQITMFVKNNQKSYSVDLSNTQHDLFGIKQKLEIIKSISKIPVTIKMSFNSMF